MTNNLSTKRVTFNPEVTGFEIMSIYDYTESEISATWFGPDEMEGITNRCFKIIMRMQNGAPRATKKYCMRGLEGHTRLGSIDKKENRSAAMAAVLIEQSNQWIDNRVDGEAIADAYRRTTSNCQMRAQAMGNRDQETASAIMALQERQKSNQIIQTQHMAPGIFESSRRAIVA